MTLWTKTEDRVLRASRALSSKQIVRLLPGRTVAAVDHRRCEMRLGKSEWQDHELDILRDNRHLRAIDLLPLLPGRTLNSIEYARVRYNFRAHRSRALTCLNQTNSQESQPSTPG